ncbi:FtsB family cell division protein [Porphyromonas pogonae]|uniref:FtsB family cell division protein n=1 Tax=Porphyromonas pogonae TaxID=867595 RepID=UPI002E7A8B59|nr:septum formation initiator family protein [Porphyromonas pogonae]
MNNFEDNIKNSDTEKITYYRRISIWWKKHPWIKYAAAFVIVFMIPYLFGESSVFRQIKYSNRISHLRKEIRQTENHFKEDSVRLEEIRADKDGVEHTAREQYLMKSPDEVIFLIKDKEPQPEEDEKK